MNSKQYSVHYFKLYQHVKILKKFELTLKISL